MRRESISSFLCLVALTLGTTACDNLFEEHGGFGSGPVMDPSFFLPSGTPVSADVAPRAIHGGTLLVTRDNVAIAGDPDRDAIFGVDLDARALRFTTPVPAGSEPGRMVEDDNGLVHVALRRGGGIVTLDPVSGELSGVREVCASPSGIDFDPATRQLHVACVGGQLVSLPVDGGPASRALELPNDLRDVLVYGDGLLVSRFRAAEVLVLDADGAVTNTLRPPRDARLEVHGVMAPTVAYRIALTKAGVPIMLHQRSAVGTTEGPAVEVDEGGYGGGGFELPVCDAIVQPAVSVLDPTIPNDERFPTAPLAATLVTDLAVLPHDQYVKYEEFALAATGNSFDNHGMLPEVMLLDGEELQPSDGFRCNSSAEGVTIAGEITSVAYDRNGNAIMLSREPAELHFGSGSSIMLSDVSRRDTGSQLFHADTGAGIACASCHPAGLDDGHTWSFDGFGDRRSQTLAGTLAHTAPYHWDGLLLDLPHLFAEVFMSRMSGAALSDEHVDVFADWLLTLEATPLRTPADPDAVERGAALFTDAEVACVSCHVGDAYTNNITVNVGTGFMQVPPLKGLAFRAPFMHDGCAPTLMDRFLDPACGGPSHGKISHLSVEQLADLVAYLETL